MNNSIRTDFLTSRSSWITGAGTVFNLGGTYFSYNASKTDREADAKALASDWRMVGQDLRQALRQASGVELTQLNLGI